MTLLQLYNLPFEERLGSQDGLKRLYVYENDRGVIVVAGGWVGVGRVFCL